MGTITHDTTTNSSASLPDEGVYKKIYDQTRAEILPLIGLPEEALDDTYINIVARYYDSFFQIGRPMHDYANQFLAFQGMVCELSTRRSERGKGCLGRLSTSQMLLFWAWTENYFALGVLDGDFAGMLKDDGATENQIACTGITSAVFAQQAIAHARALRA